MMSFFLLCFVGVTCLGDEATDVKVVKGDVLDGVTRWQSMKSQGAAVHIIVGLEFDGFMRRSIDNGRWWTLELSQTDALE